MSEKISEFVVDNTVTDDGLITYVKNNQNFTIKQSDYITLLGVTGTIVQDGAVSATPVLDHQGTVNNIRNLEDGSGVKSSVSPENGITLDHNFTVDGTGAAILASPTAASPILRSMVGTGGISATVDGNTVVIDGDAGGLVNRVIVTKAADLSGTLDSTVEYFIDGSIDMGSQQITVPAGGLSLRGYNFDISKLTSTAASYTMFISPGGGSGNLLGQDFAIEVTGASSQVYDLAALTGNEAIEFNRVNYNNCTSLGEIDNYRQGLETGTGRFGGQPSLTLTGAWAGGYFIDTSIVRGLDSGMTGALFEAGTAFVMQSRFRSNANIDLPANAAFFDFAAVDFPNPSTLQIDSAIITRNGVSDATDSNLTPNIAASNLSCSWMGNQGLENTFVGGQGVTSVEVATTISIAGTFVDLAGTVVASDLQHFDSPSNGQLRHLGTTPVDYQLSGQVILSTSANDEVDLKVVIFRSATTSFEDGKTTRRVINNLQGGRNVAYYGLVDNITLNQNDYVKLQVANVNATNNITSELDSYFLVGAR